MHSLSSLVSTLAIASTVIASPLNKIKERNAQFSVHQTSNPGFNGFYTTGQAALAKVYAKYAKHGAVMPLDVSKAISAAMDQTPGTVSATPERYDRAYLCPVSIGTPAQVLNLDFDTGSADLWVFSTETLSSNVSGQVVYDPSKSSTSVLLIGETWSTEYADGSSSFGDVYEDLVNIGGISYASQAVESAEQVSSQFTRNSARSGLLGLAFSNVNQVSPTQQNTFFANVQSTLASPVFTADLKYEAPGTYDFGFIDPAKYTGSITYTPVASEFGFWEFVGSGYAVGNGAFVEEPTDIVADTGASLLVLPSDIVVAYYSEVPGAAYSDMAGAYVFPCTATLPDFTFGVGSYLGTIPGNYINYAKISSTTCYGGIQLNTGINFSIYGDILLKAQFVVFDGGNNSIGFAAKDLS